MRHIPNSAERIVALSLAGLILFTVANVFPFLSFQLGGQTSQTTLFTGVYELYKQGMFGLSLLVFFTSILAPFLQLTLMLYIFTPILFGRVSLYCRPAWRILHAIQKWNMIEVFMIGILVSLVKLVKMADIVPGIALWSFMALIFLITGAAWSIDGRVLWNRLQGAP